MNLNNYSYALESSKLDCLGHGYLTHPFRLMLICQSKYCISIYNSGIQRYSTNDQIVYGFQTFMNCSEIMNTLRLYYKE